MKQKTERKNMGHGFTIIELIIVVAIVGILAAIAIPSYMSYLDSARMTISLSLLDSLRKDLEAYQVEYQKYPDTLDLTNFTDQNSNSVLFALPLNTLRDTKKISSWVSYAKLPNGTYELKAKAVDSKQTEVTLTPGGTFK